MTNFERILSEARELLTPDERHKLCLVLAGAEGEGMDAEERAALDQAIEDGFDDFERGHFSDARVFAQQLLARS